eukprot:gene2895-3482_t
MFLSRWARRLPPLPTIAPLPPAANPFCSLGALSGSWARGVECAGCHCSRGARGALGAPPGDARRVGHPHGVPTASGSSVLICVNTYLLAWEPIIQTGLGLGQEAAASIPSVVACGLRSFTDSQSTLPAQSPVFVEASSRGAVSRGAPASLESRRALCAWCHTDEEFKDPGECRARTALPRPTAPCPAQPQRAVPAAQGSLLAPVLTADSLPGTILPPVESPGLCSELATHLRVARACVSAGTVSIAGVCAKLCEPKVSGCVPNRCNTNIADMMVLPSPPHPLTSLARLNTRPDPLPCDPASPP